MPERRLYKVAFVSQGQVYEVYARKVTQGGLLGFVEVEGLVSPAAGGKAREVLVDKAYFDEVDAQLR